MPCDSSLSEAECNALNDQYEIYKLYNPSDHLLSFEDWRKKVQAKNDAERNGAEGRAAYPSFDEVNQELTRANEERKKLEAEQVHPITPPPYGLAHGAHSATGACVGWCPDGCACPCPVCKAGLLRPLTDAQRAQAEQIREKLPEAVPGQPSGVSDADAHADEQQRLPPDIAWVRDGALVWYNSPIANEGRVDAVVQGIPWERTGGTWMVQLFAVRWNGLIHAAVPNISPREVPYPENVYVNDPSGDPLGGARLGAICDVKVGGTREVSHAPEWMHAGARGWYDHPRHGRSAVVIINAPFWSVTRWLINVDDGDLRTTATADFVSPRTEEAPVDKEVLRSPKERWYEPKARRAREVYKMLGWSMETADRIARIGTLYDRGRTLDAATIAWGHADNIGDMLALSAAACRAHGIASALSVFRWALDLWAPNILSTILAYTDTIPATVRQQITSALAMLDRWADVSCHRYAHPEFDGWRETIGNVSAVGGEYLGARAVHESVCTVQFLIEAAVAIEAGLYGTVGLALREATRSAVRVGLGPLEKDPPQTAWCAKVRSEFVPPTLDGMIVTWTQCETLALVLGVSDKVAASWLEAGFDVGDTIAWSRAGYTNAVAARAAVKEGKRPWNLRRGRS